MNLFKRLFRIGSAEANSLVDKLEDPIKMTEQGIRELKTNLGSALQALAEVKALAIRAKNDGNKYICKSINFQISNIFSNNLVKSHIFAHFWKFPENHSFCYE